MLLIPVINRLSTVNIKDELTKQYKVLKGLQTMQAFLSVFKKIIRTNDNIELLLRFHRKRQSSLRLTAPTFIKTYLLYGCIEHQDSQFRYEPR